MGEFKEELSIKTDLFFYTGTGNSLWAARMLTQKNGYRGDHPDIEHYWGPVRK
jgi:hypothetical protein